MSDAANNLPKDALIRALEYIRDNKEIKEVILTGGDPLVLSDGRLKVIMDYLGSLEHVEIIRLHTRIPTALPARITNGLINVLKSSEKSIWVVAHINAATELNNPAKNAIQKLLSAGIPVLCQSVLLKGVNDTLETLLPLLRALIRTGVKPYYIHYPDLARGTNHFRIPLQSAIELIGSLRGKISGFAIPTLIVDIPGGHGKISLDLQRAENFGKERWRFTSPTSGDSIEVLYPEAGGQ